MRARKPAKHFFIDESMERKFWERVVMVESCWHWTGALTASGYGVMFCGGQRLLAHRLSYKMRHGGIDQNLTIDHLCRTRDCVNPDHLELVTHEENCRRGQSPMAAGARRVLCIHGHPLDGNTAKQRYCKTCHRIRSVDLRRRRKFSYSTDAARKVIEHFEHNGEPCVHGRVLAHGGRK